MGSMMYIEEELLFTCLKERANFFKDLQKNKSCKQCLSKQYREKIKNPKK